MGRSTSKVKTVKVVRSVHRRAKFVGVLYFIATLLLTVLSFVTFFTAPYTGKEIEFSTGIFNISAGAVSSFWAPLLDGVSVYFIAATLYIVLLLILIVNLISSCLQLKGLFRKYSKAEQAATAAVELARINKKKYVMERLGKIFSSSLATLICLNLVIYLILPFVQIEIFAFVAVGVGVFFHLICGLLGAKVTEFNTNSKCWCGHDHYAPANYAIYDPRMLGSHDGEVHNEQTAKQLLNLEKRVSAVRVFFFRNIFQLMTVFGLVLAVANVTSLHIDIAHILGDTEALQGFAPEFIDTYVVDYVLVALQAVVIFGLCMLITHATSITEFNDLGMEGRGMKRFKLFSILTLIGGAGYMAMQMTSGAGSEEWIPVGFIVALAFLGFVVDCIVRPKNSGYGNLDDENKILFYSEEMEEYNTDYMRARYRA